MHRIWSVRVAVATKVDMVTRPFHREAGLDLRRLRIYCPGVRDDCPAANYARVKSNEGRSDACRIRRPDLILGCIQHI